MNISTKITWTWAARAEARFFGLNIAEHRRVEDYAATIRDLVDGEAVVKKTDVLAVVRCRQASAVAA